MKQPVTVSSIKKVDSPLVSKSRQTKVNSITPGMTSGRGTKWAEVVDVR